MTFSIIDSEGATIATFDEAKAARAFLRELLRDDASARDDLAVIEYDDEGARVGEPILVGDFLQAQDGVATLLRLLAQQGPMTTVELAGYLFPQAATMVAAASVQADQAVFDFRLVEVVRRDRLSLSHA